MADLSAKFRDDPMAPAELVKYWTEYVLRHRGALHLRPADADMPLYQFLLIDVIFLILCATVISGYLLFILTKYLIRRLHNLHKRYVLKLKFLKFGKAQISVDKKVL